MYCYSKSERGNPNLRRPLTVPSDHQSAHSRFLSAIFVLLATMTDRLAALRAQRAAANGDAPTTAGATQSHELTPVEAGSSLQSMPGFLEQASEVQDDITRFNGNVTRIAALNNRVLEALDDAAADPIKAELDELVTETMALSNSLRNRIKALQAAAGTGGGNEMRQTRVTFLRNKFMEGLQTYQTVEQEHRAKARTRVERQYRIVKPDATQEEITHAVATGQDQVFMQALTTSTRYVDSRQAYNEVQARSQDLKRMEQTLAELAQMFSDMALLVEQQDEHVMAIEKTAGDVEKDAEMGYQQVERATVFARAARKKRWICFIICLICVAILAAVLATQIPKH
ncbi:syntaxin [Roridomyces roridus]|uniref:Syntaxin n=1 Tax=Roridomyces roridus TaxID=1738132 RepID=A0AAD7G147_9AGAR|nr:syntaxin [Roridomyces roridus]